MCADERWSHLEGQQTCADGHRSIVAMRYGSIIIPRIAAVGALEVRVSRATLRDLRESTCNDLPRIQRVDRQTGLGVLCDFVAVEYYVPDREFGQSPNRLEGRDRPGAHRARVGGESALYSLG